MAKETTIIFLYDTELLKHEEDDPNSAILYFYPTWVSDHQKTALCGQLIGTIICLRGLFSMPKSVSLQTGKFFIIRNGRYILVVGTDRNISDWVLEQRATRIYSLINFFHGDFITLALTFESDKLQAKLYHIFDTYLKLLYLNGSIFSFMPLWDSPKTESDLHENVGDFLKGCQNVPHCLGGTLLYYNKIVQTQLSKQTSKMIAFSDPYHIRNPAELSGAHYKAPQGVKLLQIFIPNSEYENLPNWSMFNCAESTPKNVLKQDSSFYPRKVPPKKWHKRRSRPVSLDVKGCSTSGGDLSPITPLWGYFSAVSTPLECKSFVNPPKETMITRTCSLSNLTTKSGKQMQRWNSLADPQFPYLDNNRQVAVSCFLSKQMGGGSGKTKLEERKKSLTLPIKPPNASEPMRCTASKSPGGYTTPLMNKLATTNPHKPSTSSFRCKLTKESLNKTETNKPDLRQAILFLQGEKELVLAAVLSEQGVHDPLVLQKLHEWCTEGLPDLEKQLEGGMEVFKGNPPPDGPYSVLSLDADWETVKRDGLWEDMEDLTLFHGDYLENPDLTDIYLRKPDSILFAHQEEQLEVYYQEGAAPSKGLLPPNDALGTVHHTAKKKLEKYHNLTMK